MGVIAVLKKLVFSRAVGYAIAIRKAVSVGGHNVRSAALQNTMAGRGNLKTPKPDTELQGHTWTKFKTDWRNGLGEKKNIPRTQTQRGLESARQQRLSVLLGP